MDTIYNNDARRRPNSNLEQESAMVDGIKWEYDINDGLATIKRCKSPVGALEVPRSLGGCPVRQIGDSAFDGCANLRAVKFPRSVWHIGKNAFRDCAELETIDLTNEITRVGEGAFCGCSALKSVYIAPGWRRIEPKTFKDCKKLTSIIFPNVYYVGEEAFAGRG